MKISIAKTAGFCMGVRRAVEMVLDSPGTHENPIYTYGPLIHNPQVLHLLEEKGISILKDIPDQGKGTVLIRAHGVPPKTKEKLIKAGFRVIDATCPRVIKVQTIIYTHARKGNASIIVGDRDHPEVIGLLGYAGDQGYVVDSVNELEKLPAFKNAIVVAQTTQNTFLFEEIKAWTAREYPHYKIFDTICDSTEKRQAEVRRLSETVDAMIVVGGRNSGNTQRLTEIAKQSGKPVYHVEEESELDHKALAETRNVGITAGASTPNWIIKRVYRALETIPFKRTEGWLKPLFSVQRTLLLTNIYVALGAGCLCYAGTKLQGIDAYFPHVLISILYVLSMHILNHLTGIKADHYNDPDRASFYNHHMVFLTILALTAGGCGLFIAFTMGSIPFFILSVMSLMGLSYNMRIIPERFARIKIRRIRDIPGSKTILIAIAWGVVTSILPSLSASGSIDMQAVIVFVWAMCMVFSRTAFFDILDMQGDRIVGKETIPILLGERHSISLLKHILLAMVALLVISSASGLITNLGYFIAVCPIFIYLVLLIHEQGYMLPGMRLEFLVESHFVLAGAISFLWSLFYNA
jgi:(E)-4-hydroxy-3-methyl-but-2-enyl pyrophosphate reductase